MKTILCFIVGVSLMSSACFAASPTDQGSDLRTRLKQRLDKIEHEAAELGRLKSELGRAREASEVASIIEETTAFMAAITVSLKGAHSLLWNTGPVNPRKALIKEYRQNQKIFGSIAAGSGGLTVGGEITREMINSEMVSPLLKQIQAQEENLKVARKDVNAALAAFQ